MLFLQTGQQKSEMIAYLTLPVYRYDIILSIHEQILMSSRQQSFGVTENLGEPSPNGPHIGTTVGKGVSATQNPGT